MDSVYARFRKLSAARDTAAWKELRLLENAANANKVAAVYYHLAKADAHLQEQEREQAFGACMNALDLAGELRVDSLLFRVNYKIGDVYMKFNDLPRALAYFNKALLAANSVKNLNELVYLYREIALVYTYLDKNELAVTYFKKVEPLVVKLGNRRFLGSVYNNLGLCFIELRDSARARSYLYQSLAIRQEIDDRHGIAQTCNNLGALYFAWELYPRALAYYKNGLALRLAAKVAQSGIVESKINIGKTYRKLNETQLALQHLEEARTQAIQLAHIELERRADEELMDLYSQQGNYRKAFELQARYYVIRDSLYGLDKKEEIGRLTFEGKIREDSLRHAEARAQQQAVHLEKEKRSALIRNFFIAGFVLLLCVALLLYKQVKRIRDAHAIIKQQRDQLEAKQKEVLDSIHYAKRIQQSLLAPESYINRNLKRLLQRPGGRKAG